MTFMEEKESMRRMDSSAGSSQADDSADERVSGDVDEGCYWDDNVDLTGFRRAHLAPSPPTLRQWICCAVEDTGALPSICVYVAHGDRQREAYYAH